MPRVAFVGDEALEERDISPLAVARAVVDPARKRGDVRKYFVRGQESSNLEVWIQTRFNAAKEFEDKAVTVD